MKKIYLSLLMSVPLISMAQNPVIRDQFSADPTARVFNNRVYLYPSHDIMPPADQRQDWFCMEDYQDGGKQFYRLTAIDMPADLCFWPNKEIALHKTYAPDKNVFNLGLRFVRNDADNMFLLTNLEVGDIITICANVEPQLFSKSTCVTLQNKEEIPSEDFVYGNKHRTFPMQQFTYTVTRAGDQAFLMEYGKILYSVKVVKP